jgi:hypothetical protein
VGSDDADFTHRNDLYNQIVNQYNRYIGNVLAQVGGIYLNRAKDGSSVKPSTPVDRKTQKASLKWVLSQLKSSSWLDEPSVTSNFPLGTSKSCAVCSAQAKALVSTVAGNVMLASSVPGVKDLYTIRNFFDDLYSELFASSLAGRKLTAEEKTLQREALASCASSTKSLLGKSLTDGSEALPDQVTDAFGETMWCGFDETAFGQGDSPYQRAVNTAAVSEVDGYRIAFLNRVKTLTASLKSSAPAEDRAHYEYLHARAATALQSVK